MIELRKIGKKYTVSSIIKFSGPAPFLPITTMMFIEPAEDKIIFVVPSKNRMVEIPVSPEFTKDANGEHTTLLSSSNHEVKTVEHILSALSANGIDACKITLCGSNQVPVPDRSAEVFTNGILSTLRRITKTDRVVAVIKETRLFSYEGSMAILQPGKGFTISALIQFPEPIGEEYKSLYVTRESYLREVGKARSFLRSNCDKKNWKKVRKIFPSFPINPKDAPVMCFNDKKWIVAPNFVNEPVSHKILDAIGDLSLLGYPIEGRISLIRPGHEFNRRLVKYLYDCIIERK